MAALGEAQAGPVQQVLYRLPAFSAAMTLKKLGHSALDYSDISLKQLQYSQSLSTWEVLLEQRRVRI